MGVKRKKKEFGGDRRWQDTEKPKNWQGENESKSPFYQVRVSFVKVRGQCRDFVWKREG